ncbi:hypothetical protein EVAR_55872_1 [Eumeta japonica]|uniref:Uncharacterized protein n=1 Tax=Eumeta variegata TaxID=151549 RepID=A0A4C1YHU2_EUMVA|nr:hypothetical protein EVAR_55872_1 [Eumeta japonica]
MRQNITVRRDVIGAATSADVIRRDGGPRATAGDFMGNAILGNYTRQPPPPPSPPPPSDARRRHCGEDCVVKVRLRPGNRSGRFGLSNLFGFVAAGRSFGGITSHLLEFRDLLSEFRTRMAFFKNHRFRVKPGGRSTLLQHKNGPAPPVKYRSLTENGREVAASVVEFRPESESSGSPFAPPSPYYLSINLLHQIFYSHPRGRQRKTPVGMSMGSIISDGVVEVRRVVVYNKAIVRLCDSLRRRASRRPRRFLRPPLLSSVLVTRELVEAVLFVFMEFERIKLIKGDSKAGAGARPQHHLRRNYVPIRTARAQLAKGNNPFFLNFTHNKAKR